MGNDGTKAPSSPSEALAISKGSQRQQYIRNLVNDQEDFYDLFNLTRYQDIDKTTNIERVYRKLCFVWHPDRNSEEKRKLCNAKIARISMAKEVLLNPEHKARYDQELRKSRGEQDGWSNSAWYCRWGWNVLAGLGGLATVIAVACGAVVAASVGAAIVGGALLASGIKGSLKMLQDPNCSTTEFVKDCAVGSLQGGAAASIAAVAAPAMAAAAVGKAIGIAAGVGAASSAAGHVISDVADLAISQAGM